MSSSKAPSVSGKSSSRKKSPRKIPQLKGWKGRVFKYDKKTKKTQIDKTRLIFEANKAICSTEYSEAELTEILTEINKQIAKLERYEAESAPKAQRLTDEREVMQDEVNRLEKKKTKLRKQYLHLHNGNEGQLRDQRFESIGDDKDYDITLEILRLEVDQITKDVEFLQAAFEEEEEEEDNELLSENEDNDNLNISNDLTGNENSQELSEAIDSQDGQSFDDTPTILRNEEEEEEDIGTD